MERRFLRDISELRRGRRIWLRTLREQSIATGLGGGGGGWNVPRRSGEGAPDDCIVDADVYVKGSLEAANAKADGDVA